MSELAQGDPRRIVPFRCPAVVPAGYLSPLPCPCLLSALALGSPLRIGFPRMAHENRDEQGEIPMDKELPGEDWKGRKGRFSRLVKVKGERTKQNRRDHALVNLRKAWAAAEALGIDPLEVIPASNGTKQGSIKASVKSLLTEQKSLQIAGQLLEGASDPTNPRQLDYISRLKEWIDGLETQKSERLEVQKRVVLSLGGTMDTGGSSPDAAPPIQRTVIDVAPPRVALPPLVTTPQKMTSSGGVCQEENRGNFSQSS